MQHARNGGPHGPLPDAVVVAPRLGEAIFPVDVLVTLRGRPARCASAGTAATAGSSSSTSGARAAVSAEVDPDRVLLLDVNFTNNSRTLAAARRAAAARKWTSTWLGWLQDALLTFAFFV